ncbi:MAG: family 1 encapsulin nanocompartment shell protein [Candidatus Bathyarchaeota archaeon]|nr:family 1 encapsulin nanocompartment shell protein [Candidatus Bathyarchaeota archaeon]MDH5686513.1 family 1 encapsulin nanocompartment shell protein [Candidatus Bathyarchaeota archaeon]
MRTLRKVGLETGSLTDEEIRYIDTRVVEAARPALVARQVFSAFRLPNAGFKTWRGYKLTDMGQATIDMEGQTGALDRVELAAFDVKVPVISKGFILYWRDVIASRTGGIPLETTHIENAARQVAEEEDKLLLTGEYTGWRALGIEGLATATNRNTKASAGAWPDNSITDINAAIGELETDGHFGPYALIVRASWHRKLWSLISNTGMMYIEKIREICRGGVYVSDSLYASGGGTDSALIVEPGPENFELGIGQDITTFMQQDENMNTVGKVYEVVAPRIKRPTSICEITGLT